MSPDLVSEQTSRRIVRDITGGASIAGFIAGLYYFLLSRTGDVPPYLFYWFCLILLASPLLLVFSRGDTNRSIFYLMLFSVVVNLEQAFMSPTNLPYNTDSIYQYQISSQLAEQHRWRIPMGTNQGIDYSYFPILPILLYTFSLSTGLPLPASALWMLGLVKSFVTPALLFLVFRTYFSNENALLGAFVYLTAPANLHTNAQALGIVFVLVALFCITRVFSSNHRSAFFSILFLVLPVLAMTHSLSSYILVAWIFTLIMIASLLRRISKKTRLTSFLALREIEPFRVSTVVALMFLIIILSWGTFVSISALTAGWSWTLIVVILTSFLGFFKSGSSMSLLRRFSGVELAFITGHIVLMASLTFYGILCYVRSARRLSPFVVGNFLFGGFLVLAGITFISSTFWSQFYRIFEFCYVGFAILAAYGLSCSRYRQYLAPALLLVIMVGGNLTLTYSPYIYYSSPLDTGTMGPVSFHEFSTALWFKDYRPPGEVYGDARTYEVTGGFGYATVRAYVNDFGRQGDIYRANNCRIDQLSELRNSSMQTIVLNQYMMKYDVRLPDLSRDIGPLNETQAQKFYTCEAFDRVYDNALYSIYRLLPP